MENKVYKKLVKELEKKLGKGKIFTEKEYRVAYSYDATGLEFLPDLVVFPHNEEDIKNILQTAYSYNVPVTPRAAGVGYSGGALPIQQGIEIVFTKMNRILSIDTGNFQAVVEPGVVTYHLQQEAEKHGLFYPPDPASLKTSTIGGNVAENAGGLRCFKYGVTADYVLGVEAFLVNGEKIRTGGYVIKNVAGYDIKSLLVGSEGTLAVISKIILKLIPLPAHRVTSRLDFKSLGAGARFINKIITGKVAPSVLEFMDRTSLRRVTEYLRQPLDERVQASILIELDGNKTDIAERQEKLQAMLDEPSCKPDILSCMSAATEEEQQKVWHLRRSISTAIAGLKPKKINEDIVVPVARIPEAVEHIDKLAREHNIIVILFGHFGDGNIHTNLMVDPEDKDEMQRAEVLLDKIFTYVTSVQGSISGEHGVGIAKKPFMKYQFTPIELELFQRVKQAFDPGNRLNPGKIF